MTSVAAVRVHRVDVPLVRPFVTAVRATSALAVMLVEVVDSDGRSGWGEAPASWRVTGESPESIEAVVAGPLAAAIVGRDLLELPALTEELAVAVIGNSSARSAVDCALHDLAAQHAGVPLAVALGGSVTPIRTDMTLSVDSADAQLVAARRALADGFTTIKVKVGQGDVAVDALRRLRDELGPDVVLRVDANQAWTARQSVDIIGTWERLGLGIQLVEQPVAARAIGDLAFVTARVSTLVMADESAWTTLDLLEIVRTRAADLVNVKLAKSGGISEARRMVDIACATGTGVVIGCMMESVVGVAAAASLAAAGGRAAGEGVAWGGHVSDATHDLDAGAWLAAAPVDGGARYSGGTIELVDAPGLGITGLVER